MRIYLLPVLLFMLCIWQPAIGQDTLTKTKLATQRRVMADDNTKYYNEQNIEISKDEFKAAIETGKYIIKPVVNQNMIMISASLLKANESLPEFSEAPNFSGKDVNGNTVALNQLKGKVIVLNFWFSTCIPCINEMPSLNKLVSTYQNNPDVAFIAPTFDSQKMTTDFLNKYNFQYQIVPEAKKWADDYGVTVYPTHVLIDKTGTVAFVSVSSDSNSIVKLKMRIDELLIKNAPRIVTTVPTSGRKNQESNVVSIGPDGVPDEPYGNNFSFTNKTIIIDEYGNRIKQTDATNMLNSQQYKPFKRKTKDGEIMVLKKIKGT